MAENPQIIQNVAELIDEAMFMNLSRTIIIGVLIGSIQGCLPIPEPSSRDRCFEINTEFMFMVCGSSDAPNATRAEKDAHNSACLYAMIEYHKCYDKSDVHYYTPIINN